MAAARAPAMAALRLDDFPGSLHLDSDTCNNREPGFNEKSGDLEVETSQAVDFPL